MIDMLRVGAGCRYLAIVLAAFLALAGCASEDPNIVNPLPGTINVGVRLINVVPDGTTRQLLLERNVQTLPVPGGGVSAVVSSPADSSLLEVVNGGVTEYKTPRRVPFARNTVVDVFAVASPHHPTKFDTLLIHNATAVLSAQPNAQVRVINVVPDSTLRYDVRQGCPSGAALSAVVPSFGAASLYTEQPPGTNIYTFIELDAAGASKILGTFSCELEARTPYSIVFYRSDASAAPVVMLIKENEASADATRTLAPVVERTAGIRVLNVGHASLDVAIPRTGQQLASSLSPGQLSAVVQVPTCDRTEPDVFEAGFGDGKQGTDSISLNVGKLFTAVVTDSGSNAGMIMVPPFAPPANRAGKARIRIVHAAPNTGTIVAAIGARTSASTGGSISAGSVLVADLPFDSTSEAATIDPGEIPLSITTAAKPTNTLAVLVADLLADHDYDIVLVNEADGRLGAMVIDETPSTSPRLLTHGVVVRFVNAASSTDFEQVTIGNVITAGKVFYRNSVATNVKAGSISATVGAVSANVTLDTTLRTLLIYGEGNGGHNLVQLHTPPEPAVRGQSTRRVVNVTADVEQISVALDSTFRDKPDVEKLADAVSYGQSSPEDVTNVLRRGSLYVYNTQTKELLYQLPANYAPLGNNTTLLIVGKQSKGYEVIVLQEF